MECPRCRTPALQGAGFCAACGQALAAPPPLIPPWGSPICARCGSQQLLYFENRKGICNLCKHIFRWGRTPDGGILVMG